MEGVGDRDGSGWLHCSCLVMHDMPAIGINIPAHSPGHLR